MYKTSKKTFVSPFISKNVYKSTKKYNNDLKLFLKETLKYSANKHINGKQMQLRDGVFASHAEIIDLTLTKKHVAIHKDLPEILSFTKKRISSTSIHKQNTKYS